MAFTVIIACVLLQLISGAERQWSYKGDKGPPNWYKDYKTCKGDQQSPIDIKADLAQYDKSLNKFEFINYDHTDGFTMTLLNDGHTVKVNMLETEHPHTIKGGNLPGEYRIAQYHFHWGSDDTRGSEHTISGKAYPLEMHLVHYSLKYKDIVAAINETEGLAVLGIFFEVGQAHNDKFDHIFNSLQNVTAEDDQTNLNTFKLSDILPNNLDDYWRYAGGLTTPACYESVIWTVFQESIKISSAQMAQFRELTHVNLAGQVEKLVDNYRPVQDLVGRTVYKSTVTSGADTPTGQATLALLVSSFLIKLLLGTA